MRINLPQALYVYGAPVFLLLIAACSGGEADVPLDEQAQAINKVLMCPVCPSETIDQSQVKLAEQMRTIVRERLVEGESREQILQFFVDRYGESVLAAPPKEGFNLLVWLMPPVGMLAGAALLYVTLWAMRRRPTEDTESMVPMNVSDDELLRPYLEQVDRELGLLPETTTPADASGEARS